MDNYLCMELFSICMIWVGTIIGKFCPVYVASVDYWRALVTESLWNIE